MKNTAEKLTRLVKELSPHLKKYKQSDINIPAGKGTWTPKEILGHLVDSACNNHQKFIRTAEEKVATFVGYEQDFWVSIQNYKSYAWNDLVDLWVAYNMHIAHVILHMPAEKLTHQIAIDGIGPFTLGFIMEDYTEHQIHHLKVILPEVPLTSNFKNIYKP